MDYKIEEMDDEVSQDGDSFDEVYWRKKSNETLLVAQRIFEATQPIYDNARFNYCKFPFPALSQKFSGKDRPIARRPLDSIQ